MADSSRVLLIGGTDSSGGAGISRDVATATALGAQTCLAVTAVTAQSHRGVTDVHAVPPSSIRHQIVSAENVHAIKTGMLVDEHVVATVAESLPQAPLVIDPVIASSSGHQLLSPMAIQALIDVLVPGAEVITPNLPELRVFADVLGVSPFDERRTVDALLRLGARHVLVTGGHRHDQHICEDWLYSADQNRQSFQDTRLSGTRRGTGCQLATAIAVSIARGESMSSAVESARQAVRQRFHSPVTS